MADSVSAAIKYIKETVTRDRCDPVIVAHIEVLLNHIETTRDVTTTELKELVQAVKTHNERLDAVLDKIPSGVSAITKQAAKKEKEPMRAYFSLEDWLYTQGKDKSMEIKSAMIWGGLWVLKEQGSIDWNTMLKMYGEYMSKSMSLR